MVGDFYTENPAMKRCLQLAALAGEAEVPVLVLGETGTGKTLLAQAIHNSSRRAKGQFVSFNASAMSDTLLESQLFGHDRGAFTGAQKTVKGKFELANGGTLFFDEIADMSGVAQAKILRAVEYGEFERLGSEQIRHSNARIISATNASLRGRIRSGHFREDLYHRLAGLTLFVPPLRDRPEDLMALIATELDATARAAGKKVAAIHPEAMARLATYSWPGNLRELHHTVRTIILFCNGPEILPEHVIFQPEVYPIPDHRHGDVSTAAARSHPVAAQPQLDDSKLASAVLRHVRSVYENNGRNQRQTARALGISRTKLGRHLKMMAS